MTEMTSQACIGTFVSRLLAVGICAEAVLKTRKVRASGSYHGVGLKIQTMRHRKHIFRYKEQPVNIV
jgi:hypothetical protein